ncbi:hypothetical protein LXA43DRAFT_996742, partial [Ganoderma leucocontextum]
GCNCVVAMFALRVCAHPHPPLSPCDRRGTARWDDGLQKTWSNYPVGAPGACEIGVGDYWDTSVTSARSLHPSNAFTDHTLPL